MKIILICLFIVLALSEHKSLSESSFQGFMKEIKFQKFALESIVFTMKNAEIRDGYGWKVHGKYCGKGWCRNNWWKDSSKCESTVVPPADMVPIDATDRCCMLHDACCTSVELAHAGGKKSDSCNCNIEAGECFYKASLDPQCRKSAGCLAVALLGGKPRKALKPIDSCGGQSCFQWFNPQKKQFDRIKAIVAARQKNLSALVSQVRNRMTGMSKWNPLNYLKKAFTKIASKLPKAFKISSFGKKTGKSDSSKSDNRRDDDDDEDDDDDDRD